MSRRTKRVTMKDVAERAGVDTSTVSLVLADKPVALTEETRRRVRAAATELGYRRNVLAAGLRRRTSDTIGVVADLIATTPHAGQMVQGAQDAAWAAGKMLLMVNTGADAELEDRAIAAMLARQVDGIVYAAMYHRVIEPPAALHEVPSVLLDARSDDEAISSVAPASAAASKTLRRRVAQRTGALERRVAGRLPASQGRVTVNESPSAWTPVQALKSVEPTRAATRGARSRPVEVAAVTKALAPRSVTTLAMASAAASGL